MESVYHQTSVSAIWAGQEPIVLWIVDAISMELVTPTGLARAWRIRWGRTATAASLDILATPLWAASVRPATAAAMEIQILAFVTLKREAATAPTSRMGRAAPRASRTSMAIH